MVTPVNRDYALRLSRPLPRHLRDEEFGRLLKVFHTSGTGPWLC